MKNTEKDLDVDLTPNHDGSKPSKKSSLTFSRCWTSARRTSPTVKRTGVLRGDVESPVILCLLKTTSPLQFKMTKLMLPLYN